MIVSIVVLTYNSNEYIIETLESIKEQSYDTELIELIITDDFSTDNTVEIVEDWIDRNGKRFNNIKILKSNRNLGVAKNLNNGLKSATGSWVKPIAGDDILFKNCIFDNVEFINNNKKIDVLFSYVECFGSSTDILPTEDKMSFFKLDTKQQYKYLSVGNILPAPAIFYSKKLLIDIDFCDENINYIEDWSTYFRILENDFKFYFMNKKTVFYRMHQKSISLNINSKFLDDIDLIYIKYIKNKYDNIFMNFFLKIHYKVIKKYSSAYGLKKKLLKPLSPLYIYSKLKRYL